MPAQQVPQRSMNLAALAQRYATPIRCAYLLCVAFATLLRLGFDPSLAHALERVPHALLPHLNFKDVVDAARNIALFFGWGVIYALTSHQPTRRRDVIVATLLGLLASLSVESAQLFSLYRQASVVDVATNTLGSLLGAISLAAIEHRARQDMRRGTMIGVPGWLPAGSLLLTAAGLSFAPSSRAAMVIGWASSPLGRWRMVNAAPAAAAHWSALLVDWLAWASVGLAVGIAISDRSGRVRRGQLLAWLLIAPGVLGLVHLGRGMVGLQRDQWAVLVQAGALGVGVLTALLLVPRWRSRVTARATRAGQLGLLAGGLGAVMAWIPVTWLPLAIGRPRLQWQQLIPMLSLLMRQDMSSVFLVVQRAGLGAAVGACLAARKRVGAPSPGILSAVLYAAVLELGQMVVPGRYPDVTDILITGAAACLVLALVERADGGNELTDPAFPMDLNERVTAGRF